MDNTTELKDISLQEQRELERRLNEVVAIGNEHKLPLWHHVVRLIQERHPDQMGFNCNSGEALIEECKRRRLYHKYAKFDRILAEVHAQGSPGEGGTPRPAGPRLTPCPGPGNRQADHEDIFKITLRNIPHDDVRDACRNFANQLEEVLLEKSTEETFIHIPLLLLKNQILIECRKPERRLVN